MIHLDLTIDEFTSLIAHFGIAVTARTGKPGAHHFLAVMRLPVAAHDTLTAKLIEAMKELERREMT
jgi:hypothetical protein